MKNENAKTILRGILAVGISLGLLAGVLTAAGMPSAEGKPYDGGSALSDPTPPGEKPMPAQPLLEEKFAAYNINEGDGLLRLFSRAQWSAREEKRKAGERFFLTYRELCYLITDTLELYETYDALLLTEERTLPIHKTDIFDIAADLATFDLFVESGRKTLTELSYPEAQKEFEKKQADLRAVLLYRLYMLDSGWRFVYYTFDEEGNCKDVQLSDTWDRSASYCMLTLSLDEGSAQSTAAYEEALAEDCLRRGRGEKPLHPLLQIYMDPTEDGPSLRMTLWDTESDAGTELYPGTLLDARQPKPYLGNLVPATREGEALALWAGQGEYLETLLADGFWEEGGVDCAWTYSFTVADGEDADARVRYTYHPGCGVIYDEKNQKYMDLGGLEQKTVNRFLAIASGTEASYGGKVTFLWQDVGTITVSDGAANRLALVMSAGVWEPADETESPYSFCMGEAEFLYCRENGTLVDLARGEQMRLCEKEKDFVEEMLCVEFRIDS